MYNKLSSFNGTTCEYVIKYKLLKVLFVFYFTMFLYQYIDEFIFFDCIIEQSYIYKNITPKCDYNVFLLHNKQTK